jgi:hypothetical protein
LGEDIPTPTTERYPPDDLKTSKKRDERWKNGNNRMKERKPDVERKEDTKEMPRKEEVAISRLKTGYTKATHSLKMKEVLQYRNPQVLKWAKYSYLSLKKNLILKGKVTTLKENNIVRFTKSTTKYEKRTDKTRSSNT